MHHPRFWPLCAAPLCALIATCAHANDDIDTSWNGTGTALVPVPGHNVSTIASLVQADGRILLAAGCVDPSTPQATTICMARLQPSGLRDYNFGPDQTGVFTFSQFPSWPVNRLVRGLSRQSDDRIIAAGAAAGAMPEDTTVYASVARLLADGTLDPSVPSQPVRFEYSHHATNAQSLIVATAPQADGKLVAAGITIRAGSNPLNFDIAVARLSPNLTLDPTFNGNGIRLAAFDLGGSNDDIALALAIQRDGKIVVAGASTTASNGFDAAVLRLNADGTFDNGFGNVGRVSFDFFNHHLDDQFSDVKIDGAGRIWLAGAYQASGSDLDFIVARLRADGTLDTSFCGQGFKTVPFDLDVATTHVRTDTAWRVLLQSDGKVVLTGSASNGALGGDGLDFAAARLMPDCTLDSTFGTGGKLHGRFTGSMPYGNTTDAAFVGGGIVLTGNAASTVDMFHQPENAQFGAAMIRLDLIFKNGFDP